MSVVAYLALQAGGRSPLSRFVWPLAERHQPSRWVTPAARPPRRCAAAPRPPGFVPIAAALAALLGFALVVGATSFDLTGYGGGRELVIAFAILGSSLALYAYRRLAQDRRDLPEEVTTA